MLARFGLHTHSHTVNLELLFEPVLGLLKHTATFEQSGVDQDTPLPAAGTAVHTCVLRRQSSVAVRTTSSLQVAVATALGIATFTMMFVTETCTLNRARNKMVGRVSIHPELVPVPTAISLDSYVALKGCTILAVWSTQITWWVVGRGKDCTRCGLSVSGQDNLYCVQYDLYTLLITSALDTRLLLQNTE